MRSILSKATTGAMIAGAALLVAACGGNSTNNVSSTNVDAGNELPAENLAPIDTNAMPGDGNTAPTDGNTLPTDANASGGNTTNSQ